MTTTPKPLARLPSANAAERRHAATIGLSDITELVNRIRRFQQIGGVLLHKDAEPVLTKAAVTRQLLLGPNVEFDIRDSTAKLSGYTIENEPVLAVTVKGSADAIARDAVANMGVIADRMQRGEIDVPEFFEVFGHEVKVAIMGQGALAHGGIERMTPEAWDRLAGRVQAQFEGVQGKEKGNFPGLRAFCDDIAGGRYGEAGNLSEGMLNRANAYGNAGRGVYENERLEVAKDNGRRVGMRVAGAIDHCPTCSAEDGVVRPIEEIVPICDSECGGSCCCAVVTADSEDEL